MPKQGGGTSQIQVNPTQVRQQMKVLWEKRTKIKICYFSCEDRLQSLLCVSEEFWSLPLVNRERSPLEF